MEFAIDTNKNGKSPLNYKNYKFRESHTLKTGI